MRKVSGQNVGIRGNKYKTESKTNPEIGLHTGKRPSF